MKSIRTKISLLNVLAISISLIVATVIASITIASFAHTSSEKTVELSAETGKNNLNYYFKSIEQTVNTISNIIGSDLDERIDDTDLANSYHEHVDYAEMIFKSAADNTNGVYDFYYRVDLSITEATGGKEAGEKGFWFIYSEENERYEEHVVSPLDESACPWFHEPKQQGKPVWLLPYSTDNLDDVYVLSYNVPIYRTLANNEKSFVGVAGIEISYLTLGEQIKDIKVLEHGYAFLVDNEDGTIIWHPEIDLYGKTAEERPQVPERFLEGLKNKNDHIVYSYNGVTKHCHIIPLGDVIGMSIVVAVPEADVNGIWLAVINEIIIAALLIFGLFITVTLLFSRRFTQPLKDLTVAAEQINKGNYNVTLNYNGKDEIGVLTNTVSTLIGNLKGYINDLNSLAYADALTEVRNKSAFDVIVRELQKCIDNEEKGLEFAIAIFDCDDLKGINDAYGHDKGNVYLKNASHLMCRIFQKSVVYRVGGDEFAIILRDADFKNRESLKKAFINKSAEICKLAKEPWEQIRVSVGIAAYDPKIDQSVKDVIIHADHLMYANKRERKKNQ